MISGLVSITFRNLTPREICALCEEAGLHAVEWGGDVHVPPEGKNAAEVRRMSADSGLDICSYGSYFRIGNPMDDFMRCLDAAGELGTPVVRVWCGGNVDSSKMSDSQRKYIVESLLECCAEARKRGIIVAPEFHGGTLTDSNPSVEKLLCETAGVENLKFYWQPRWDWTEEETLHALEMVKPRLAHAHVFTWRHVGNDIIRLPIADGEKLWNKALPMLGDCYSLIEFVKGDRPQQLIADAAVLNKWIKGM